MLKKITMLTVAGIISVLCSVVPAQALAGNQAAFNIAAAYPKGTSQYDVVVKAATGSKLALYVNDKHPVHGTANSKQWTTFRRVKLATDDKLSFTMAPPTTKGVKSAWRAVNYVRYFQTVNGAASFLNTLPAKATSSTVVTPTTLAPPAQSTPAVQPPPSTPAPTPAPPSPTPNCTNGTYVNSAGNTVCSPETAPTAPAGATARCADGTYSFSQSRSGTCSHHGGVASWL